MDLRRYFEWERSTIPSYTESVAEFTAKEISNYCRTEDVMGRMFNHYRSVIYARSDAYYRHIKAIEEHNELYFFHEAFYYTRFMSGRWSKNLL